MLRVSVIFGLLLGAILMADGQQWTAPGPPEQRFALVIGNADYRYTRTWPKLPDEVTQQAQQMAATLQVLGFKVYKNQALLNQNLPEMRAALDAFFEQKEIQDGAFFWVFYAGHGIEGSLIPVDAQPGASYSDCCLSLKEKILDPLEDYHPKAAVVVINACRDKVETNDYSKRSFDEIPEPGKNIYLAFSTHSGNPAVAQSAYVPELLRYMTMKKEQSSAHIETERASVAALTNYISILKDQQRQAMNVQAIFSLLDQQARSGQLPSDPITYGTIPDSAYLIPPDGSVQYIDFHEADNDVPDFYVSPDQRDEPAAPYLDKYGISVEKVTSGTNVVVTRPSLLYSAFSESGAAFVMLQEGDNCNDVESVTYTLKFSPPLKEFAFSRIRLVAESKNGISHPKWEAHAYDPNGKEIQQEKFIGEELITYIPPVNKGAVPESTFHMRGPYISSVTFTSSNRRNCCPFAAFCSVQISRMGLVRGPSLLMSPDEQKLQSVAWEQ